MVWVLATAALAPATLVPAIWVLVLVCQIAVAETSLQLDCQEAAIVGAAMAHTPAILAGRAAASGGLAEAALRPTSRLGELR